MWRDRVSRIEFLCWHFYRSQIVRLGDVDRCGSRLNSSEQGRKWQTTRSVVKRKVTNYESHTRHTRSSVGKEPFLKNVKSVFLDWNRLQSQVKCHRLRFNQKAPDTLRLHCDHKKWNEIRKKKNVNDFLSHSLMSSTESRSSSSRQHRRVFCVGGTLARPSRIGSDWRQHTSRIWIMSEFAKLENLLLASRCRDFVRRIPYQKVSKQSELTRHSSVRWNK